MQPPLNVHVELEGERLRLRLACGPLRLALDYSLAKARGQLPRRRRP